MDYEDKLANQRDDEGDLLKEDIKRSTAYVGEQQLHSSLNHRLT